MVGCDGAKSFLRKAVDISFPPYSEPMDFLVADVLVTWGIDLLADRVHLMQNACGVLICIPLANAKWRVLCMRKCSVSERVEPFHRLDPPDFMELQQIFEAVERFFFLSSLHVFFCASVGSWKCFK